MAFTNLCDESEIEFNKCFSPEQVKVPELEKDIPKTPGKISGGTEFNNAVNWLANQAEDNTGKIMFIKADIGRIKKIKDSRDVSKQEKEISQNKKCPIVLEYLKKQKKYRIVDGEHRFLAYKKLGVKSIPAVTQCNSSCLYGFGKKGKCLIKKGER